MSIISIQDRNEVHVGYILTVLETVNLESDSDQGDCVFTVNPAESANPDASLVQLLERFQKKGEHRWTLEMTDTVSTWRIIGKEMPDLVITIANDGRGMLTSGQGDNRVEAIACYTEEDDLLDSPDDDITVDRTDREYFAEPAEDDKPGRMMDLGAAIGFAVIVVLFLLIDYLSASYWFGRSWTAYPLFAVNPFVRLMISIGGLIAFSAIFACGYSLIRSRGRSMIPVAAGLLIIAIVCLSFMRADSTGDEDIARFCRGAEARLKSAGVDPEPIRKWGASLKFKKPGAVEVPLESIPSSLRIHQPRSAKVDSMAGKAVFTFGPYSGAAWYYIVTWKTELPRIKKTDQPAERDYVTVLN